VCERFMLTSDQASTIANQQIAAIRKHWDAVCAEAGIADGERRRLWRGAALNDFCFEGWD